MPPFGGRRSTTETRTISLSGGVPTGAQQWAVRAPGSRMGGGQSAMCLSEPLRLQAPRVLPRKSAPPARSDPQIHRRSCQTPRSIAGELHKNIRDEEVRQWGNSEYDAIHADVRYEYAAAQVACSGLRDECTHLRRAHEQHAACVRREVAGRIRPLKFRPSGP